MKQIKNKLIKYIIFNALILLAILFFLKYGSTECQCGYKETAIYQFKIIGLHTLIIIIIISSLIHVIVDAFKEAQKLRMFKCINRHMDDIFVCCDKKLHVEFASQRFCDEFNTTLEQTIGKSVEQFVEKEQIEAIMRIANKGKKEYLNVAINIERNSKKYLCRIHLGYRKNGEISSVTVVVERIETLQNKSLINTVEFPVFKITFKNKIIHANQEAQKIMNSKLLEETSSILKNRKNDTFIFKDRYNRLLFFQVIIDTNLKVANIYGADYTKLLETKREIIKRTQALSRKIHLEALLKQMIKEFNNAENIECSIVNALRHLVESQNGVIAIDVRIIKNEFQKIVYTIQHIYTKEGLVINEASINKIFKFGIQWLDDDKKNIPFIISNLHQNKNVIDNSRINAFFTQYNIKSIVVLPIIKHERRRYFILAKNTNAAILEIFEIQTWKLICDVIRNGIIRNKEIENINIKYKLNNLLNNVDYIFEKEKKESKAINIIINDLGNILQPKAILYYEIIEENKGLKLKKIWRLYDEIDTYDVEQQIMQQNHIGNQSNSLSDDRSICIKYLGTKSNKIAIIALWYQEDQMVTNNIEQRLFDLLQILEINLICSKYIDTITQLSLYANNIIDRIQTVSWVYDVKKDSFESQLSLGKAMGYDLKKEEVFRLEDKLKYVHIEDRERVRKAFDDYIQGKSETLFFKFRGMHKEVGEVPIEGTGVETERDKHGRVLRIIGTRRMKLSPNDYFNNIPSMKSNIKEAMQNGSYSYCVINIEAKTIEWDEVGVEFIDKELGIKTTNNCWMYDFSSIEHIIHKDDLEKAKKVNIEIFNGIITSTFFHQRYITLSDEIIKISSYLYDVDIIERKLVRAKYYNIIEYEKNEQ